MHVNVEAWDSRVLEKMRELILKQEAILKDECSVQVDTAASHTSCQSNEEASPQAMAVCAALRYIMEAGGIVRGGERARERSAQGCLCKGLVLPGLHSPPPSSSTFTNLYRPLIMSCCHY